jgi:hypothetical protein
MKCVIQLKKMLFHVHLYIQSNLLSHHSALYTTDKSIEHEIFHCVTQRNQLTPFESKKGDSTFI